MKGRPSSLSQIGFLFIASKFNLLFIRVVLPVLTFSRPSSVSSSHPPPHLYLHHVCSPDSSPLHPRRLAPFLYARFRIFSSLALCIAVAPFAFFWGLSHFGSPARRLLLRLPYSEGGREQEREETRKERERCRVSVKTRGGREIWNRYRRMCWFFLFTLNRSDS